MPVIQCKAKLYIIGTWSILRLPAEASARLPSRGQVMVVGTLNDVKFQAALEPDGRGGHWLAVGKHLQKAAKATAGNTVALAIEPTKTWPEPALPTDWKTALDANPRVQTRWMSVTPMARWEWIRWIGSTANPETRKRHIEVACSKLLAGERRPCCFNRNMCCVPEVSKNGVLLEPGSS